MIRYRSNPPALYAVNRRDAVMAAPARVRAIVGAVAVSHGVTVADILGDSRVKKIAWARCAAYAAVRAETGASFPKIGRWFRRHHTTVLTGIRSHKARLAEEAAIQEPSAAEVAA
jgi:chromosomal replication initiation ATPase DnaA